MVAIPTVFKSNRMRYDQALDTWILTTDLPLPDQAVLSAVAWVRKVQVDRLRAATVEHKRTAIQASLVALDALRVKQQLVNGTTKTSTGDLTLVEGKL